MDFFKKKSLKWYMQLLFNTVKFIIFTHQFFDYGKLESEATCLAFRSFYRLYKKMKHEDKSMYYIINSILYFWFQSNCTTKWRITWNTVHTNESCGSRHVPSDCAFRVDYNFWKINADSIKIDLKCVFVFACGIGEFSLLWFWLWYAILSVSGFWQHVEFLAKNLK